MVVIIATIVGITVVMPIRDPREERDQVLEERVLRARRARIVVGVCALAVDERQVARRIERSAERAGSSSMRWPPERGPNA